VTADGSGNWSQTIGALADGSYSYTATATDPVGNTATSDAFSFTVDTTAPSAPTIADSAVVNGYVNAANDTASQALVGTAEPGSTVNIYLNGASKPAYTVTADGSGNWSQTIGALADASYSYRATATDAAGNSSSPSDALNFTVDATTSESVIADAAVTKGTDGKLYINPANFNGGSTTLTGTAEAGDTVTVSINGGLGQAATMAPDGNWGLTLSGLKNGDAISAVATATDPVGNTATSDAFSFTVDTTAPSAPTIADSAAINGYVNAANDTASQALTGTAEPGSTVNIYLNGASTPAYTVAADGSGNWSQTIGALADGSYSYTATATDAAGNSGAPSDALTFTVDTTTSESAIADAAVTKGTDGKLYINPANFNGGSTTLTGTAEAGDIVTVSINGAGQAATMAPDGSWGLTLMYGPAVRCKRFPRSWRCGLASMYPASDWSMCSRPSWISARV
jgi:hypothetical protein